MRTAAARAEVLAVWAFPLLLSIGIATIPLVVDYADHGQAERAAEQSARWLWGHVIAAGAFGLGVAAAAFVLRRIRELSGRAGWSLLLVPFALGAALHAAGLGADGVGPLAAARAGGSAGPFFDGSAELVTTLFGVGSVLLAAGQIFLTIAARRSGLLAPRAGTLALGSAIAFAALEALPSGLGLYGVALASWGVYAPLARALERS